MIKLERVCECRHAAYLVLELRQGPIDANCAMLLLVP